ncbi:uncharacterized protein RJT21DRAFT_1324 [Scheffersomyces amazonensis]|uniref:uncharacterized protein n=1 Tax=Scheffersomyces amazonensis TaxID=1078765 RepID=UPI00315CBBBE
MPSNDNDNIFTKLKKQVHKLNHHSQDSGAKLDEQEKSRIIDSIDAPPEFTNEPQITDRKADLAQPIHNVYEPSDYATNSEYDPHIIKRTAMGNLRDNPPVYSTEPVPQDVFTDYTNEKETTDKAVVDPHPELSKNDNPLYTDDAELRAGVGSFFKAKDTQGGLSDNLQPGEEATKAVMMTKKQRKLMESRLQKHAILSENNSNPEEDAITKVHLAEARKAVDVNTTKPYIERVVEGDDRRENPKAVAEEYDAIPGVPSGKSYLDSEDEQTNKKSIEKSKLQSNERSGNRNTESYFSKAGGVSLLNPNLRDNTVDENASTKTLDNESISTPIPLEGEEEKSKSTKSFATRIPLSGIAGIGAPAAYGSATSGPPSSTGNDGLIHENARHDLHDHQVVLDSETGDSEKKCLDIVQGLPGAYVTKSN